MPEKMPQDMSATMSKDMNAKKCYLCQKECQNLCRKMLKKICPKTPEDISGRLFTDMCKMIPKKIVRQKYQNIYKKKCKIECQQVDNE